MQPLILLLSALLSFGYNFQDDERVLHVGCGCGEETARLAQKVPDGFVLGIDSSAEKIETARHRYDLDLFANLDYQEGEVASLPSREKFDLVTTGSDFRPDRASLEAIHRLLRPGGHLVSSFHSESEEWEAVLTEIGFTVETNGTEVKATK